MTRRRRGLYEIIGAVERPPLAEANGGGDAAAGQEQPAPHEGGGNGKATAQAAVFLDRDGTIIRDVGFVDDPARVELLPSAAEAIRRLNRAGLLVVVATNQSGVARGLFSEDVVKTTNRRIQQLLAERGAQIDAFYHCPFLEGPEAVVDAYRQSSDWRKPEPGMLHAAADDLGIDLSASWMIGDAARDVEAGRRAGCRTILVGRNERIAAARTAEYTFAVRTLSEAVDIVEREMSQRTNPTPAPVVRVMRRGQSDAGGSAGNAPENGAEGPGAAGGPGGAGGRESAGPDRAAQSIPAPRQSRSSGRGVSADDDRPDAVESRLIEIRDLLDAHARRDRQTDFSLLRLVASLLQMLAAVGAMWGVAGLLSDSADAVPRLLLACFLQLAAATAMLADRFR